jgi:hypothetical protein
MNTVVSCPTGYKCTQDACVLIESHQTVSIYQRVLNMLQNNCAIFSYETSTAGSPTGMTNGAAVCASHGMTCISAELAYPPTTRTITSATTCVASNTASNLRAVCCTVP